jgi:thiol-disulfide isomerase/thioredoxin
LDRLTDEFQILGGKYGFIFLARLGERFFAPQMPVLGAALDPDVNVRETALSLLSQRKDAALTALAAEQLKDPDQHIRLLGLNYLKQATPATGVPLATALLNDADAAVVGMSVKLLEQWSGEKFGVKLADTVLVENKTNGLPEFQAAGVAKTEAAAAKAKAWWSAHQAEFPPVKLQVPAAALGVMEPVPAGDFELRDLDGRKVRLSNFRGKVVLINFWTTWCTACVGEIPELIALQNSHSSNLVILGVSLDLVPDDDGDITPNPQTIPKKVARTVKSRGINYPVYLDEHNEIGGRFNGGELPTTVIVDAQGNVRRRFVGARSLPVFEAMLDAASRPANAPATLANQQPTAHGFESSWPSRICWNKHPAANLS